LEGVTIHRIINRRLPAIQQVKANQLDPRVITHTVTEPTIQGGRAIRAQRIIFGERARSKMP
jgi:hypothetical protein